MSQLSLSIGFLDSMIRFSKRAILRRKGLGGAAFRVASPALKAWFLRVRILVHSHYSVL